MAEDSDLGRIPDPLNTSDISAAIQQANTAALSAQAVDGVFDGDITGNAATVTNGAYTTGTLAQFSATTSAQLKALLTDETGTGLAVFNDSPTLIAPRLGTPFSGNLANCTFPTLNQNTSGNAATATLAATVTTNANLSGPIQSVGNTTSVTAQTGTGTTFVMQASPTLTTPDIGTPTHGVLDSCTTAVPTASSALANKQYVDQTANANLIAKLASTTVITGTYNNGSSGVGATLTVTATGLFALDSNFVSLNDLVLIKDQGVNAQQNGYYVCTTAGAVGVSAVFTRSTLYDTVTKINNSGTIYVTQGSINAGSTYYNSTPVVTLGSSLLNYTQTFPQLPVPASSTLGGVKSLAVVASKWINTISTTGTPAATQPAFSDISGTASAGQLPSISLTSGVSGILPVANGGTGLASTNPIVQRVSTVLNTTTTGSTIYPIANPSTNTAGNEYFTVAITPKASANILVIEAAINITSSALPDNIMMGLFQDSTTNALNVEIINMGIGAGSPTQITMRHIMAAGTTSATTFKIRAGTQHAGTTTVNGSGGATLFGNVQTSYIMITEYVS